MKRTGEVTLGIIGAVIYAGLAIIGIVLKAVGSSEEVKDEMETQMQGEPDLSSADISATLDAAGNLGLYFIIFPLIAIILGIVAMVLLRGNKNPKAAGIIFVATGVIATIGAVIPAPGAIFFTFLPGLFYVIAGIMALTRKQPHLTEV